jgi:hypothetical protein
MLHAPKNREPAAQIEQRRASHYFRSNRGPFLPDCGGETPDNPDADDAPELSLRCRCVILGR